MNHVFIMKYMLVVAANYYIGELIDRMSVSIQLAGALPETVNVLSVYLFAEYN